MLAAAALLVLLVLRNEPPQSWFGEAPEPGAWRRRELWTAALLIFWSVAMLRAGSLIGNWRGGELDWLVPRTSGLGRALIASWAGCVAAMLIGIALVAMVAELSGGPGPSRVDRGWYPGTAIASSTELQERRWSMELPQTSAGAQLAVQVEVRGYRGPAVDARLSLKRGDHETGWNGRLGRAREVMIDLPAGSGPAELSLERLSDGAALFVERRGAELFEPANALSGVWGLFSRVALAAAFSLALAIGLGAWMSTPSAILTVLAMYSAVWIGDATWPVPGSDLFAALDALGRGRAAGDVTIRVVLFAVAGVIVGLGAARIGLARQRRLA